MVPPEPYPERGNHVTVTKSQQQLTSTCPSDRRAVSTSITQNLTLWEGNDLRSYKQLIRKIQSGRINAEIQLNVINLLLD